MLRALYPFKKTHPTSLTFTQGDLFVELPGASGDKNWHYVLDINGGAGYVPKNYVFSERPSSTESFRSHVDGLRDKVRMLKIPDKDKGEILAQLEEVKSKALRQANTIAPDSSPPLVASSSSSSAHRDASPGIHSSSHQRMTSSSSTASASSDRSVASAGSDRGSTPPKSSKKRAAPRPPSSQPDSGSKSASEKQPAAIEVNVQIQHTAAAGVIPPQPQHKAPPLPPTASSSIAGAEGGPPELPARKMSIHNNLNRRTSLATEPTTDQIKVHSRELVELVRIETGLSHENSQSVVQTVLNYVFTNFQRLDRNVPAMLTELERPVLSDQEDVAKCADTKMLEDLFEKLTKAKDDEQQRNWMLFEDEGKMRDLIQGLSNTLQTSNRKISVFVMSKFKYFYVLNLVEYFQMETRWRLRRLLIEVFMVMCSIDAVIISLMLNSVLPLELAQDLYQNTSNVSRMRHCALLLTIVFSTGEPMPVHYFNQLGASFVNFLLDYIEAPPTQDQDHEIPDVFIGVALSYNIQFPDITTNVLVSCLSGRAGAKVWTEKILLLLNREEDPSAIVARVAADSGTGDQIGRRVGNEFAYHGGPYDYPSHQSYSTTPGSITSASNSVHKILIDMFVHDTCAQLFYTNDVYVLIDIIVRQLADLSPEEPRRLVYCTLCKLVLAHEDYEEHLHRFKDLERVFMRILDEEEDTPDRKCINRICKDIKAFSSLVGSPF